jgi:hypothetical protein
LDEAGYNVSMRCRYERSEKGRAAIQRVPNLKSRNISFCYELLKSRILHFKKQTREFDTETFSFFDEIINKLNEDGLNNMVFIMDNVAFHKSPLVAQKILNSDHTINFIPAYSPFLNPIENMFFEVKSEYKLQCLRSEKIYFHVLIFF